MIICLFALKTGDKRCLVKLVLSGVVQPGIKSGPHVCRLEQVPNLDKYLPWFHVSNIDIVVKCVTITTDVLPSCWLHRDCTSMGKFRVVSIKAIPYVSRKCQTSTNVRFAYSCNVEWTFRVSEVRFMSAKFVDQFLSACPFKNSLNKGLQTSRFCRDSAGCLAFWLTSSLQLTQRLSFPTINIAPINLPDLITPAHRNQSCRCRSFSRRIVQPFEVVLSYLRFF